MMSSMTSQRIRSDAFDGLCEGVVVAISDTAHGRLDAGLG